MSDPNELTLEEKRARTTIFDRLTATEKRIDELKKLIASEEKTTTKLLEERDDIKSRETKHSESQSHVELMKEHEALMEEASVRSVASQTREVAHRELIEKVQETMSRGGARVEVAKRTNLPSSDDFVGIPGPASAPAPRSIAESIQGKVSEGIQKIEDEAVHFKTGMERAGRELGAEAQEAYSKGDYVEALAKGTAAFTARAGTGIYDAATFLVRPLAWGKTGEAIVSGVKGAIEKPEEIPSGVRKWAENIAKDPGSIVQLAGDVATGLAVGEVIKTITGPSHVLTRLDDVDIDVKSTTLKLVDEADPMTGSKVKVTQFPEAELKPTITKRKIPKTVSEIIDAELEDVSGSRKILGVVDEGGITLLDKIDLPEGTVDDLLSGKTVKLDDVIEIETVKTGSETFRYVEEISDPLSGTKTTIPKTEKATPLDAKEIGVTMEIAEDASKLSKLTLEVDETQAILPHERTVLVKSSPPDIDFDTVKFKSLWNEEGVKGVLDEGKHSYDVKGMVVESTETLDDLIDDVKPIEPTSGPKTPIHEHFQQPGYTAPLKNISDSLAEDITIVRELTEGVKPISKIIDDPPKGTGVSSTIGIGTSIDEIKPTKPPESISLTGLDKTPARADTLNGILSGVQNIDESIMDTTIEPIQETIPTIEGLVIDEKPRTVTDEKPTIIERARPDPKQIPKPKPPFHTFPPIDFQELEEDTDVLPITITRQDPVPIQKDDTIIPIIPDLIFPIYIQQKPRPPQCTSHFSP